MFLLFVILSIILALLLIFNKRRKERDENIYIEDEYKDVRNDGRITLYEEHNEFDETNLDTNFNATIHRSFYPRNIILCAGESVSVFVFPSQNKRFLNTSFKMNANYEASKLDFFNDDNEILKTLPLNFIEIPVAKDSLLHIPKHTFVAIEKPEQVHVYYVK